MLTYIKCTLLLLSLVILSLSETCKAAPRDRGRCYPFPDIAKNGHLIEINTKGRLDKGAHGVWKANQIYTSTPEWQFTKSPLKIVNYSKNPGKYLVQVMVSRGDLNPAKEESYWFTLGGGDQCEQPFNWNLNAIFARPSVQIVGVWHYSLSRWP